MVKDIIREIKKKWFQFVAILIITSLGVGFFVGIQVTGYNMRQTGDLYTQSNQIMDYYVSTSLGVDQEMVDAVAKEVDATVFGSINGDGFLHQENFDHIVHAYDYDDHTQIDLSLEQGRLPQAAGEFVIDEMIAKKFELKMGEVYELRKSDVLKSQDLKLVGTVNSSLYFNQDRGHSKLGVISGFIYAQGLNTKEDVFTGMRIIADDGADVAGIKNDIESIKETLLNDRYHRIVDPIQDELEEAQSKLDEEIIKADAEFESAWRKIEQAEMDLEDAKNEIINATLEINPELSASNYIDYYESSLLYVEAIKLTAQTEFDAQRTQIQAMPDGIEKDFALEALLQAEAEFTEDMTLVDQVHLRLQAGIDDINTADQELLDAKEQFQKEKKEALVEIEAAQDEINDGLDKLSDFDKGNLYNLDRAAVIVGYTSFYDDSQRIESIGKVFPLVFFGVAVLVTLSTITRMIDESRIEIGIYKAMGYGKMRTTMKFAGFTFYAWLIGAGLGLLMGFSFIPVLIYNAYRIMYITPEMKTAFVLQYAWMPVLFSFMASVGISFIKAYGVSSELTASLLMPPSPAKGQRIFLERIGFIWNRMSFLYKVTFRNLIRNKTRFLMTVVGIGGCCGLLITGFGIEYSINSIVDKQFDEVIQYDAIVAYEKDFKTEGSIINESTYADISVEQVTVDGKDVSVYAVDSLEDFSSLVQFKNRVKNEVFEPKNDDVIITEKLAIMNGLSIGDTLQFNEGDKTYEVEITGITENYVAHYVYMSKAKFKEITGYLNPPSLILLQYDGADMEDFAQTLRNEDAILSVNVLEQVKITYNEMMGSFDIVIVVIVAAAFALELIVLLNLISMNMSERKKELATLKVLGFYPKELSAYVLRENILLSIFSIIIGVGFGIYLHRFVLLSAEIDIIMFNRTLKTGAVLLACVLTLGLSIIINFMMSKKANQVNMAEALKSE